MTVNNTNLGVILATIIAPDVVKDLSCSVSFNVQDSQKMAVTVPVGLDFDTNVWWLLRWHHRFWSNHFYPEIDVATGQATWIEGDD